MSNFVPNVNQTTTLQSMADQLRIHTKLQNYFNVGGVNGEPMVSIANRVQQMLLIRRMGWKFNRVNMGSNNPFLNPSFFVTQVGYQDFKHAGASCFTLLNSTTPGGQLPAGGAGIDLAPGVYQNGNTKVTYGPANYCAASGVLPQPAGLVYDPVAGALTVQFLDPHPFLDTNIGVSVILISGSTNPAFNSKFVFNQLTQQSGWQNGYVLAAIPDQFHIVLATNGGQANTIASVSASGGITTVILGSPNPIIPFNPPFNPVAPANTSGNGLIAGDVMTFSNVGTNTALDGTTVTLLSATATAVTFATPAGVTITPGADTGHIFAANSGAPGIWNFGWLEAAALVDINNPSFPLPVTPIDAVHRIAPEYTSTGDTMSMSCEIDFGNGVLKFRLSEPVSTYPFAFTGVYQARAPKFTGPQSVFSWPDDLSYVIFELCLWQGMRFAYGMTATETQAQMQVAMLAIQSALASEDREDNTNAITPNFTFM